MSGHEGRHELHGNEPATSQRSHVVFALLAALLLGGLGIAIVTQVKNTGSGDTLDSASPADLLVVLDTLNQREAALRQEIASLEQTLATLQQSGSSGAALDEAQARLTALSIQVGSAPATGPGVTMRITDPNKGVGSEVLLDLVQELRAAGAEAVQIQGADGPPIRIGVDSWVSGSAGGVSVDGRKVNAPYGVVAIGDPPTLAAALNIPGGVVDTVARSGGQLTIEQSQQVTIAALREAKPRQYAQPGN
ncbi:MULTISPECIES: DUF881 domain-containing protein [Rhodococcus]|uniref:Division initiation protein n=2 Tax=Rhodococcus TaxID=1827 RepID=A0A2S8ILI6_RHOOP|nr:MULTISPECIES: DUF881 domain-containing protein [Rhodococcus]MDH6293099.1 uncharacterized protein YlxW (UPF0749 family) [Rhodococcus opacus]MDV6284817.1 DUF881 domain-containing protein [Rhodococcus jostii]PQP15644.1 Division initiation protein [Rhodococcus opacus]